MLDVATADGAICESTGALVEVEELIPTNGRDEVEIPVVGDVTNADVEAVGRRGEEEKGGTVALPALLTPAAAAAAAPAAPAAAVDDCIALG